MASFNLNCLVNGITMLLLASSSYASGGMPLEKARPSVVAVSPWTLEFGTRYWLSTGTYIKNLYDFSNDLVSRLTYSGLTGNSAEGFWRLTHEKGLFLKGYFGGGSIKNGQLKDEDFPPGLIPYSSTLSDQKNGTLNYVAVDLGYDFFTYKNWKIGGFLGYFYWMEQYNAFGCHQTASNPDLCGTAPVPITVNGLDNNFALNSLRVGVSSIVELTNTLDLLTDVAYIHSNLNALDFHNTRPDIRRTPDNGSGNGIQLDAILNWALNPDFTMGIGGRWWYIVSNGFSHFEETFASGLAQPINVEQNRYGLMLQANYTFDKNSIVTNNKDAVGFSWSGFYLGPNLGYGTNYHNVTITPTSFATLQGSSLLPNDLKTQNSGFLGGGQMGYNWRKEKIIVGIEVDMDYTDLSGSNGVNSSITNLTTTVSTKINWLGTVRGRLGKLASDDMLVYLTAGATFAGTQLSFDQLIIDANCVLNLCSNGNHTQTKTSWTAGAGIEYTVNHSTTFKAEYLFIDLGNIYTNTTGDSSFGMANYYVNSHISSNVVRFGLNYKV